MAAWPASTCANQRRGNDDAKDNTNPMIIQGKSLRSRGVTPIPHQLAFRLAADVDFLAAFAGLPAAGVRLLRSRLAFSADMRSTTLPGDCFLTATIGKPFCFLANNSCRAAS